MIRFDGKAITLGGVEYIIPPLSLGSIRRFKDVITSADKPAEGADGLSKFDEWLPIIHAAFQRNYPDMTLDECGELIDLSNFQQVLAAVMNVSGLEKRELKEGESQHPVV